MRYAKGHGTGNDFVILPDLDGRLRLSADLVRRLCDRHAGIGADGVLRIVTGEAAGADGVPWFMDYRNADGGVAEMCGNGIRVFARYLIDRGFAAGPEVVIGTRAGVRTVRREAGGQFSVDMGPATITGKGTAEIGGQSYPGLAVDVGNPHLVCMTSRPVAEFDLSVPPVVDDADFPDGVNVEVVRLTGDRSVEMRVHERGSGETRSCGTGAVAAAVAAAATTGLWPGTGSDRWLVAVPGGTLTVTPGEAGPVVTGPVVTGPVVTGPVVTGPVVTGTVLTGPAVIVAEGETEPGWLEHLGS